MPSLPFAIEMKNNVEKSITCNDQKRNTFILYKYNTNKMLPQGNPNFT